ncbi:MAG: hypothetical protein IT427_05425 [Pirellulales bacterium]|nr:hypothetical protein [Pirellulales bacterium]
MMPAHRNRSNSTTVGGFWWVACLACAAAAASPPLADADLTLGPRRGTLLIVGGGGEAIDEETGRQVSEQLFRKFVELAGGKYAKIAIVPTAASSDPEFDGRDPSEARLARRTLEMPHVTVVHTHDPKVADTAEFCRPIEAADGVWFGGGRQWRLVDAYGGTRARKKPFAACWRAAERSAAARPAQRFKARS